MLGAQRVMTQRSERRQPCNAPAICALQTATRTCTGTLPPSKTAARVSGGTLPMAQRFFALSAITPLTCVTPAGCGGK
jgi:hypothetical protein